MKSLIASSVVIFLIASGCGDNGTVCEPISTQFASVDFTQNTTIPAGCWLVDENIYISNNAVLTVAPGTILKFAVDTGIEVLSDGALSAVGTADNRIVFTGQKKQRGFWDGILFNDSVSFDNKLDYVTVEYAGAEEMSDAGDNPYRSAITFRRSSDGSRAAITNSTMRESAGYGLFLDWDTTLIDFTGNTITKNVSGAVYTYASEVHNLTASSTYTDNESDLVFVNIDYGPDYVDRAWANLGVPYHLDGVLILESKLTFEAGTTIKFTHESYIKVIEEYAAIEAIGTSAEPIVFTGTEETPGWWGGLLFFDTDPDGYYTPRSHLDYVLIEYGGSAVNNDSGGYPYNGNLVLGSSSDVVLVEMSNSTIRYSSGYGVWISCEGDLSGTGNTYSDNDSGPTGLELNCI